jgi:hypothetical protein
MFAPHEHYLFYRHIERLPMKNVGFQAEINNRLGDGLFERCPTARMDRAIQRRQTARLILRFRSIPGTP